MADTFTVYNVSGLPVEVTSQERADALAARYGWSAEKPSEPSPDGHVTRTTPSEGGSSTETPVADEPAPAAEPEAPAEKKK